jgi:type II secretory pathway pseudopilin PulG
MQNNARSGFTLLQLAVSLVGVGLIIGGIVVAKTFLDQFKVRSVISDFSTYESAIKMFRDQYNDFPGDFSTASTYWSSASNGNGNGYIDSGSDEDLYAWDHLQKAGLIGGTYTGAVYSGSLRYRWDTNAPGSKISGAGFYIRTPGASPIYSYPSPTNTNLISLGSLGNVPVNGSPNNSSVTPSDAYSIDAKIDDGQATSGKMYALRGLEYQLTAGKCVTNHYTSASATYVTTDTTNSCRLWLWLP